MSSPFISILIPSYNRPEYLTSTIASVLDQHGCNFEVIVSDDASPRRTEIEAVLGQFKADPRFRYIPQPRNLGWSDNRNSLVAHARGEFVMLLGDDDVLPSDALARLSAHLQANPDSDIVAFGYEVITTEGQHAYTRRIPGGLELQVGDSGHWKEVFYYDVVPMWGFHPFTLCCRRALPMRFPYDKRCGIGDDVFFLFQVLDAGYRIDVLPDILFQWRRTLSPVRGYVNLSSSTAAQDNARWAIWQLSQVTPWSHPDVQELIHSATFVQPAPQRASRKDCKAWSHWKHGCSSCSAGPLEEARSE
jgi:glycosyltransferase involved in cell wall biosynthesis